MSLTWGSLGKMKKRTRVSGSLTNAQLRKKCKELGIMQSSNPTLMEERIRLHGEGKLVTTVELWREPAPPKPVTMHHIPATIFVDNNRETTLLDIPHQVIREYIFSRLKMSDIENCLYLCKYLYEDAYHVLKKFAERLFDRIEATPFALSYFYNNDECIVQEIQQNIDKFGSIEAYVLHLQHKKQLAKVRAQESEALKTRANKRFDKCVKVCAKLNYPIHAIARFEGNSKKFTFIYKDYACHVFEAFRLYNQWDFILTFPTFVNRGNPLRLSYDKQALGISVQQNAVLRAVLEQKRPAYDRVHIDGDVQCLYYMFIKGGPNLCDVQYAKECATNLADCRWNQLQGFICRSDKQKPEYRVCNRATCASMFDLFYFLKLAGPPVHVTLFRKFGFRDVYVLKAPLTPDQQEISLTEIINFCIWF